MSVAEECQRRLHINKSLGDPCAKKYAAELKRENFYQLSGAFSDIHRVCYSVQEARLAVNPYVINWTRTEFESLVSTRRPCMFTNDWNRHWTLLEYFESMRHDDDSSLTLKVGHGEHSAEMQLRHLLQYIEADCLGHDEPLYVMDDDFHLKLPEMLDTYMRPAPFAWTWRGDAFRHCAEDERPPYRWLVIGGWRSGSSLHTDPYCSHAWNVSVKGRKRWLVFPETYLESDMKEWDALYSPQPVLEWFVEAYPRLVACKDACDDFYEFIQEPGDTVYIPEGWAHCVLNLEETVAVTHNFSLEETKQKVLQSYAHSMIEPSD